MKPRIAFCFSGQARTFDITYAFFKKNILDAAIEQGFEYDIFCVVEDDQDASKISIMNSTQVENIKSSEVIKIIQNKYGKFIHQNINKNFYIYRGINYKIENGLQAFYKINRSCTIKDEYKKTHNIKEYQIVMKLRFDLIFPKKINFEKILGDINNNFVLLNINEPLIHKIYDQYAIGNEKNMNIFMKTFENFPNIFSNDLKYNSISNLTCVMDKFILFLCHFSKYFINQKIIISFIGIFISKGNYFLEKKGLKIYNYERLIYQNAINNKIEVKEAAISFILVRKNQKDNVEKLYKDSNYELTI